MGLVEGNRLLVGVDVGENSVGLIALECDTELIPQRVLRALVVLHDSGRDGMASGNSGSKSRKRSGGEARRVRRLLRNRRRRTILLEEQLAARGYPVGPRDARGTYEPWDARLDLLDGFIEDDDERRRLLAIAIRHMSNHRGWANAWVDFETYLRKEEIQSSEEFRIAVDAVVAADAFGELSTSDLLYQADLAATGLNTQSRLRPRNPTRPGANAVTVAHVLGSQRRVDVAREWQRICRVQEVPHEDYLALARIAFRQERPKVPVEKVGFDWLPEHRHLRRATIASLEHQEYQVRQTVANLAVRTDRLDRHPRPLTVDEQTLIVDHLLGVTKKDEAPSWRHIAEEFLGISPVRLVHSEPDQSLGGAAPILRSTAAIHSLKSTHPVRQWWIQAPGALRSDFILWLADPAKIEIPEESVAEFTTLFESFADDEKLNDEVLKLRFPSGRSAHSLEALRLMNAEMAKTGERYVPLRNRLFNGGHDLRPMDLQTLDSEADHPTLQRILPIVRRFLLGIERQYGAPERVVIEHVRGAFLGFEAKLEAARDMGRNRASRQRVQQDVVDAGLATNAADVSDGVVKKFQAIRRQGSACLYCGWSAPGFGGWGIFELDHVVPRDSGGNSTRANLVAVCRDCNAAKGKQTFATFAGSGRRPGVSVEGAIERAKSINDPDVHGKAAFRLRGELIRRLKQTEEDDPVDERALASTAYAAVDLVRRVNTHYHDDPAAGRTKVYSGRIISMARHASGIDKRVPVRVGVDVKSRFDRRHHAIDAAVAALLNPSVARTLAERDDLRRAALTEAQATGQEVDQGWKIYEGSTPAACERFQTWKSAMQRLADLLEQEIERDQIVVAQPVRFSADHAALHEDGRLPHALKALGSPWTSDERARIVDDRVYSAVSQGVRPSADLQSDPERVLILPSGRQLAAEDPVFIFPDTAARIALPNQSSAKLGQSMHHARLYRWDDAKGRRQAGVVRVWASDLYDLVGGIRVDLLSAELPESSRAVRRAHPKLRDAIWSGAAEHVGTFVVGDEVLIEPAEWMGNNEPGRFLDEWPEKHWRLASLMSDSQFRMTTIYLAQEGIAPREDGASEDRRLVAVSPVARKVLESYLTITSSTLWNTPSTQILRRTALGSIRTDPRSGMPSSWTPYQAVYGD